MSHDLDGARVLVTGASGFLGRPCVRALTAAGAEVHALTSRPVPRGDDANVVWHRVDLLAGDVTALCASIAPSHLLHLAWHMDHATVYTSPENVRWARASLGLLEAFARSGGQRATLVGSCAEYDWTGAGVLHETATPLQPASIYGRVKDGLRRLAHAYGDAAGISVAWARVFFLYGPGEPPGRLAASVIRALLAGEPARCSHGRQVRDYLFIDDAADALVALLANPVTGAVNVGSGLRTPLRTLVDEVAAQLDARDLVQYGALTSPPNEAPVVVADIDRLRDTTGWSPQTSLRRGVAQTIAWWQRAS